MHAEVNRSGAFPRGARLCAAVLGYALLAAVLGCALLAAVPAALASPGPAGLPSPGCLDPAGCVPACFGAAARDPLHQPCPSPRPAYAVVPEPSVAELEIGDRCTTKQLTAAWWVCDFGPLPGLRSFALVGDSHAGHWRAALANLAWTSDWRGISITRASCPFTMAVTDLAQPLRSECVNWSHRVILWFTHHPQVDIAFVSEHAGAGVLAPPGRSPYAAKVAGYTAAWAALPASVKHIVVIRDTPLNTSRSFTCVERAIARRRPAGLACAVPRRRALPPDPAVAAARRVRSGRVQVADLTRLLCSSRLCYPVIGGVLVHRDVDHLTAEFSATLGPFLLRRLQILMARPSWAPPTLGPAPAA